MKRLELQSYRGFFLSSHLFIANYGEPRAFLKINNSSLKREFLHQKRSLFASPVKWWLDRLSVDANIIVADFFNLSTMQLGTECVRQGNAEAIRMRTKETNTDRL